MLAKKLHDSMAMKTVSNRSLNAICPYYTMFPINFPLYHLKNLKKGAWVLDPFCGRGTTAFAARVLKINSLNIDANPVAVAIAKAKLSTAKPQSIINLAQNILSETSDQELPEGLFWNYAYDRNVLSDLTKIRSYLLNLHSAEADALRGIMLGALHGPQPKTKNSYFSNQMPRTFSSKPDYSVQYWMKKGLFPRRVNTIDLITERAIKYYNDKMPITEGLVMLDDARKFKNDSIKFDRLITSPPYFGMGTYVEDQWLRNWFIGGPPQVSYYHENQLGKTSSDRFINGLAEVWCHVNPMMKDGSKVIIRMGSLASKKSDPESIIIQSVEKADVMWKLAKINSAGVPVGRQRQANHMGTNAASNSAQQEIDFTFIVS